MKRGRLVARGKMAKRAALRRKREAESKLAAAVAEAATEDARLVVAIVGRQLVESLLAEVSDLRTRAREAVADECLALSAEISTLSALESEYEQIRRHERIARDRDMQKLDVRNDKEWLDHLESEVGKITGTKPVVSLGVHERPDLDVVAIQRIQRARGLR
jgi:hypothetical protein